MERYSIVRFIDFLLGSWLRGHVTVSKYAALRQGCNKDYCHCQTRNFPHIMRMQHRPCSRRTVNWIDIYQTTWYISAYFVEAIMEADHEKIHLAKKWVAEPDVGTGSPSHTVGRMPSAAGQTAQQSGQSGFQPWASSPGGNSRWRSNKNICDWGGATGRTIGTLFSCKEAGASLCGITFWQKSRWSRLGANRRYPELWHAVIVRASVGLASRPFSYRILGNAQNQGRRLER